MTFLKLLLFALVVRFTTSTPLVSTGGTLDEDALLNRTLRDRTGKYRPDHRHEHNHASAVSHSGPDGVGTLINVNGFELSNFQENPNFGSRVPIPPVYIPPEEPPVLPPPPPPPGGSMHGPNGYANCGCVEFGRCPQTVLIGMPALLKTLRNDVRCGYKYTLCCIEDPWAGPIDQWADQVPCIAEEECTRKYADDPYDIQKFGVIGPCLGLGSVRCVDNKPPTIIIPIIDQPPPTPPTTLPPIYIPPPIEPPTVYEPPPTVYEPPPTVYQPPPTVYEPPPTVYEPPPPVAEPPTVYLPPVVETYQPPVVTYEAPVETYEPPPVVTYEAPVETYEPPPVVTYEAPVETYEPPPVVTYEAPEETYVPPVDTYEPPTPSYGVPATGGIANYPYRRYPGHYGGGFSRYGGSPYGRGYGYGYPYAGYGFRKRFSFSKGFYG